MSVTQQTLSPSAVFTTARLDDTHEVRVPQVHRQWTPADYTPDGVGSTEPEPVLVEVTAPVQLSLDDVTAILFTNATREELADDDTVRWLVAEFMVSRGSADVQEMRCLLGETRLDTAATARLACCRHRAATVFSTAPAVEQAAVPQARRELVS